MNKIKKIVILNLVILLIYSGFTFRDELYSLKPYGPVSDYDIAQGLWIILHLFIILIFIIKHLVGDKQKRQGWILSFLLVTLIGYSSCNISNHYFRDLELKYRETHKDPLSGS